ncbi:putative toxin-antitoxin system toxin component [Staphylococcus sp. CAG:324]|jgi:putative toxin-antitoxin system, toxin component|nr:ImmA/IrrE family metallo-endopeptidase [Staphylococcus sp.]CDC71371.1 putative toxin-antitoxin system toxin component [Staphylococcus sp. CAG:324]
MIKTNPLSVKDIEELASNLRKEAGITDDVAFPIFDYINELSDKGLLTIQILDNNDSYLEENVPAKYNTIDNFIYIKEQVLDDYENNIYWSNFTLAHELFHYLQSRILNFKFEDVVECKTYEDPEWQANNFAGELLVPKKYLDLDDEELVNRFKVTMECVLTRKVQRKKRNKY